MSKYKDYFDRVEMDETQKASLLAALQNKEKELAENPSVQEPEQPKKLPLRFIRRAAFITASAAVLALVLILPNAGKNRQEAVKPETQAPQTREQTIYDDGNSMAEGRKNAADEKTPESAAVMPNETAAEPRENAPQPAEADVPEYTRNASYTYDPENAQVSDNITSDGGKDKKDPIAVPTRNDAGEYTDSDFVFMLPAETDLEALSSRGQVKMGSFPSSYLLISADAGETVWLFNPEEGLLCEKDHMDEEYFLLTEKDRAALEEVLPAER